MLKNKFIFFIIIITIYYLAFIPEASFISNYFKEYDKLNHILAFFILSILFFKSFYNLNTFIRILILIIISFSIEVIQPFFLREFSFLDILANFLGIALFHLACYIDNRIYNENIFKK